MAKAFAPSVFALAALLSATLAVVACSDDKDDSEFAVDPTKLDAASDSPGTFTEGGPRDAAEGGPTSCTPSTPSPFTPTWKPPTRAVGACKDAQELKDYYQACLFNAGVTEMDGTCAKFKTDHPDCAACTEPADQGGPIQWHANRKFYTLNVAGCITLQHEGTDAGATNCGEAHNAAIDCGRQSCLSCITEANSFTLFSSCQNGVKSTSCKDFETAKTAACGDYAGALDCFPKSAEVTELQGTGLSESFYTRVIAATCGP